MKKYEYKKEGYLILGINGWIERRHDASAALIEVTKYSCRILGALEEEKVIRIKRAYDMFPTKSIQCLLNMFGLAPEDIDEIAIGWDFPKFYEITNHEYPFIDDESMLMKIFDKRMNKKIPINYIEHHLAHAACSYRTSNFKDALVFVLDGQGEDSSISIWKTQDRNLIKINAQPISNSLGYMYEALNYILGFQTYESGKSMGLAAYGQPTYLEKIASCFNDDELSHKMRVYMKIFKHYSIKTLDSSPTIISMWRHFYENDLGISRIEDKIDSFYDVTSNYRDLASSVQKYLEVKVLDLVKKYTHETGLHDICLGGGVALNCKMNGDILNDDSVDNLFINPAANDAGVSLGAALELAYQRGYHSVIEDEFTPFLGVEFTNDEVINNLNSKGIKYTVVESANEFFAESLEQNKILALFQGRNEWGPRALGNRSIIANSNIQSNLDHINKYVKDRELGRPLSPSIADEDETVFNSSIKVAGRYMNIAYYSEYNKENNPAVIHVDSTYRPGFVSENFNPEYYQQLKTVKNKLGNSVVINTSFNLKTPIICWIDDALEFYTDRDINALIFNDSIIINK